MLLASLHSVGGQVAKAVDLGLDLHPILQHFRDLPSNEDMPEAILHKKLCWMLATCTFLRPSDIARVDMFQTKIVGQHKVVHLVAVRPKETREDQYQDKVVILQIHPHESALCPVATYDVFVQRCFRGIKLQVPHKTLPTLKYNPLIRALDDPYKAVVEDTISNSIADVMKKLDLPKHRRQCCTRTLGYPTQQNHFTDVIFTSLVS
ncbi:hypothetical protein BG003_004784 [Podila horticola]|nr:hypothetical protein BG003_004784 [Podila horticola]